MDVMDVAAFLESIERGCECYMIYLADCTKEDEARPKEGHGSLGYRPTPPPPRTGCRASRRQWLKNVVRWYNKCEAWKGSGLVEPLSSRSSFHVTMATPPFWDQHPAAHTAVWSLLLVHGRQYQEDPLWLPPELWEVVFTVLIATAADEGGYVLTFCNWFHGIITRTDAEVLLEGHTSGTFLTRLCERRYGYSLSVTFHGRCKHFMIELGYDDCYNVVGNDRAHPSLNDLVDFHKTHPVTDDGDKLEYPCPTSGPRPGLDSLKDDTDYF